MGTKQRMNGEDVDRALAKCYELAAQTLAVAIKRDQAIISDPGADNETKDKATHRAIQAAGVAVKAGGGVATDQRQSQRVAV